MCTIWPYVAAKIVKNNLVLLSLCMAGFEGARKTKNDQNAGEYKRHFGAESKIEESLAQEKNNLQINLVDKCHLKYSEIKQAGCQAKKAAKTDNIGKGKHRNECIFCALGFELLKDEMMQNANHEKGANCCAKPKPKII